MRKIRKKSDIVYYFNCIDIRTTWIINNIESIMDFIINTRRDEASIDIIAGLDELIEDVYEFKERIDKIQDDIIDHEKVYK